MIRSKFHSSIAIVVLAASAAFGQGPLEPLGLGPISARAQQGTWLYLCPEAGGLVVVDATSPEQPRVAARLLEGRWCSRLVLDGANLIVLETREEALTLSLANPSQPLVTRGAPAAASAAAAAAPAQAPPPAAPAAVASAKVIEVRGGRVVFDGGIASGFRPGMRVRVLSQREVSKPDLISGGTIAAPSGEVTAVLAIEQAEPNRAMAILGRGDLAEIGDLVEPTDAPTSERLMFPRRAPFSFRTGFQLRPFLGLEGQSKPVGFLIDAYVSWYAASVPLALHLSAAPMAFAVNSREQHYPGAFSLAASYVTDFFEIGLGVGGLIGNKGPCNQIDAAGNTFCESNNGVTINQRLRLGALDGFHLEWASSVFSRPDRFVFGGGRGEIAVPLNSRLGLFGAGGAGENGWGFGELGVRTWVSGAGASGTLILSASLGYSAIFDGPSRELAAGPAVGFGMEWRL